MKKVFLWLFSLSLLLTAAAAQQPMREDNPRQKEMMNPVCNMTVAQLAKARTEHMTTLLQLSADQSKKIHSLLLAQGRRDSVISGEINRLRTEQMNQYSMQNDEIKKILTPQQIAALNALPAMQNGTGEMMHGEMSQCCPSGKMKPHDAHKAMMMAKEDKLNSPRDVKMKQKSR